LIKISYGIYLSSKFASDTLLHSYKSFNGFVARLTKEEAGRMKGNFFPTKKQNILMKKLLEIFQLYMCILAQTTFS